MASRQQILLQDEWVARVSDQVDTVCEKIKNPTFRTANRLEGGADDNTDFSDMRVLLEGNASITEETSELSYMNYMRELVTQV